MSYSLEILKMFVKIKAQSLQRPSHLCILSVLWCAVYLYFFMNIPPFSLFSDNCLSPCIQKLCPPLPVIRCILSPSELLYRSVDITTAAIIMQMFVKLTNPCTYSKYQPQSSSQHNLGNSLAIFMRFLKTTPSHNPKNNSQGLNINL